MPTIVYDYFFTILRGIILLALNKLVVWGFADATQTAEFAAYITGAVLVIGWGLMQKYRAKQVQLTAQTMPKGTTESEVREKIATGVGIPSVLTPATAVPVAATKESLR